MSNPSRNALKRQMTANDIFTLRRDGHSVDEIAAHVRLPPIRVKSILSEALAVLDSTNRRTVAEVRALDLARLDVATKAVMPKVEAGDSNAIHTLIKVQQRRAALLGLDAPKESIVHNNNLTQEDLGNLPTETLKQMVLDQLEARTIDVTPSEADPDPTPDSPDQDAS